MKKLFVLLLIAFAIPAFAIEHQPGETSTMLQQNNESLVAIFRGDTIEAETEQDLILIEMAEVLGGAVPVELAVAAIGDISQAASFTAVPVALLQLPKSTHEFLEPVSRKAVETFHATAEAKARAAKQQAGEGGQPPRNG